MSGGDRCCSVPLTSLTNSSPDTSRGLHLVRKNTVSNNELALKTKVLSNDTVLVFTCKHDLKKKYPFGFGLI